MKRSLLIQIVLIFTSLFSGCLLSKTPSTNDITMNLGDKMTFSVNIFPSNSTYTWTLDGAAFSNTGKTYVYTAEAGKHTLTVKAKHICGKDIQTWNVYGNSPPVSNAGPEQTIDFGATVTLDGSGSTDPDLNIVSYKWKQTGGPTVTLNNADTDKAKFTASGAGGSVLTFELTVADAGGLTSTDTCKVSVSYIMFNKTFGGSSNDYVYAVQLTSDGGYILAGYTSSYGAGGNYAWLIKTDAYGNKVWEKIFEGDRANAVQQTSDGGYILAGETQSNGADLIKTDANGSKVWDNIFGGATANAVQQTSDGGYILAGRTGSIGAGYEDVWLIKTDTDGNKVWEWTFGGNDFDEAHAVQQTSDGGYILAGWTQSYGAGYADAWLIKTDADGNKVWDRTFGGIGWDQADAVQQTSDGGYILAGWTESYGAGRSDVWLIKTDADGNEVWDRTFGGSDYDEANAVQQMSDGGYILAGWTQSYGAGNGNADAWLIKTDADGNEVWDRTFGGSGWDEADAFQQTSDKGYILAGYTLSYGSGNGDAWLIKTDADGNKVWDKIFGGSDQDWARAVQLTIDGGYILAGWTGSYGAGGTDAWLIKTDADGNAPATPTP